MNNKLEKFYYILGMMLAFWYWCLRWTWYNDPVTYWWAYKSINMVTAYTSILFTIYTLPVRFVQYVFKTKMPIIIEMVFYLMAIFLCFRNIYYTFEDITDLIFSIHTFEQFFFILVDIAMVIFTVLYMTVFFKYDRNKQSQFDYGN